MRASIDAQRQRHADEAFPPNQADLDASGVAPGHGRDDPYLDEQHMREGLVRLDQDVAPRQGHRLQLGAQDLVVRGGQDGEQPVADVAL